MEKNKDRKDKRFQTRFTEAEYKAIEEKAAEENRTVANLIRTAVKEYINK